MILPGFVFGRGKNGCCLWVVSGDLRRRVVRPRAWGWCRCGCDGKLDAAITAAPAPHHCMVVIMSNLLSEARLTAPSGYLQGSEFFSSNRGAPLRLQHRGEPQTDEQSDELRKMAASQAVWELVHIMFFEVEKDYTIPSLLARWYTTTGSD